MQYETMKKFLLGFIPVFILTLSCNKSKTISNYNYNTNTSNPSTLPSGSLFVDINGEGTYFDSAVSANVLFNTVGSDTGYSITITGYNNQATQVYSSIQISLRGWVPFDTASFSIYDPGGHQNLYQLGYHIYSGANSNAYGVNNNAGSPQYAARITYIDDSTLQGYFSAYLNPYNLTNGAFNIKMNFPSAYFQ
jgi:hypothetical protein